MKKTYIIPTTDVINVKMALLQAASKGKDYQSGDEVLSPGYSNDDWEDEEEY